MPRAGTPAGLLALAALTLAAGCGGDDSEESFQQEVVAARDRADSALAQVTQATSGDDLITRLRTARDELATVSGEIGVAEAPESLQDERRRFAGALSDLSQELDAFANSLELLNDAAGSVQGLNFENWDRVQNALAALRDAGIDVAPLERHGGG